MFFPTLHLKYILNYYPLTKRNAGKGGIYFFLHVLKLRTKQLQQLFFHLRDKHQNFILYPDI